MLSTDNVAHATVGWKSVKMVVTLTDYAADNTVTMDVPFNIKIGSCVLTALTPPTIEDIEVQYGKPANLYPITYYDWSIDPFVQTPACGYDLTIELIEVISSITFRTAPEFLVINNDSSNIRTNTYDQEQVGEYVIRLKATANDNVATTTYTQFNVNYWDKESICNTR